MYISNIELAKVCLIPGAMEAIERAASAGGNMAVSGVAMGVTGRRNGLYLGTIIAAIGAAGYVLSDKKLLCKAAVVLGAGFAGYSAKGLYEAAKSFQKFVAGKFVQHGNSQQAMAKMYAPRN